eukprot:6197468-Pleurochrysis_carterae.AAC.1
MLRADGHGCARRVLCAQPTPARLKAVRRRLDRIRRRIRLRIALQGQMRCNHAKTAALHPRNAAGISDDIFASICIFCPLRARLRAPRVLMAMGSVLSSERPTRRA